MFGQSNKLSKTGSQEIKPVSGIGQMRGQFEQSITIKPSDVKPENVARTRKKIGELTAYSMTLEQLTKAKEEEQKLLTKVYKQTADYAVTASQNELAWQQTTTEVQQKLSPLMLKIQGEKNEQLGFSSYLPDGVKLLKY